MAGRDGAPGRASPPSQRLIEGVGRTARRVVETYDKVQEAQELANSAQAAVATLAAAEVGAVGLGTLIAILATTVTADVTGVLLASVMATLGLFIIPARRRQAKSEMHAKISALRQELVRALRTQFEREIDRSVQKIQAAIAPYTRFVRSERDKLLAAQAELDEIKKELNRLKVKIDEI